MDSCVCLCSADQITIDRLAPPDRQPKVLDVLNNHFVAVPSFAFFTLYCVLPSYKKVLVVHVQQRFAAAANVALLVYYRILCPRRNDCPMIN